MIAEVHSSEVLIAPFCFCFCLCLSISLAGCVAIEHMGGPHIEWTGGRKDKNSEADCPPVGRLPDGALGKDHVLDVFVSRLGFTVQETVALIGAHTVGRCHADRSGFDGPWTETPTRFSNQL